MSTSRSSATAVSAHQTAPSVRFLSPTTTTNDSDSTANGSAEKPNGTANGKKKEQKDWKTRLNPQKWNYPSFLSWVPAQLNWQGFKPVIRCSIATWISFILLFCRTTEDLAGQAAFLYLVVGFIQPPVDPVVPTFIRSIYNVLFVCFAWTVSVLAQLISWRLRGYPSQADAFTYLQTVGYTCPTDLTSAQCLQDAIFSGMFLEAGPIAIHAVFLFVAVTIIIWIKTKYKQYVFSCVFATIGLVIFMSYGPLFPYFDGTLGLLLVIPMGIQSSINVGCACFIFPQTVSHKYLRSLITVLHLVRTGIAEQTALLAISPVNTNEWAKYRSIQDKVQAGKAIFIAMIPMEEFLTKEFSYGRLNGKDVVDLKTRTRKLLSGLGGFHYWYFLVEAKVTVGLQSTDPSPSIPSTPRSSQVSLEINDMLDHGSPSHSRSHLHLPQLAALNRHYEPVGVLESQTYMDLEASLQNSLNEKLTHYEDMVLGVSATSSDLLSGCERGMDTLIKWFECVNSDRFYARLFYSRKTLEERKEMSAKVKEAIEILDTQIGQFKKDKRMQVVEPYLKWFHKEHHRHRPPSYRLLFHSFFYQFHLMEFATSLLIVLVEINKTDEAYPRPRWWFPGFLEVSRWIANGGQSTHCGNDEDLAKEDQDPEEIPHIRDPDKERELQVQQRNPDAGPPTNIAHLIGRFVVRVFKFLGRPDIFFVIKAGILTVVVAQPAWYSWSAGWWYTNRGIWCVIMASLTISQFTADTIFGFVCRLFGTFLGAVLGLLIWYMGSGSGTGNAFGLAAIMAVILPVMIFVYISPMPAIIFCITTALIIGYSWHDTHFTTPTVLGYGWTVAYRRFLAVAAGITFAFVGSLLPKPTSGRSMIRTTCSRTITELGQLHSDIAEYATNRMEATPGIPGKPEDAIPQRQVAIQAKLNATKTQIAVQKFEPPLQGPWPRDLYSELVALQVDLIDLYGSFHSLLQQLEPAWVEALLTRNGWLDVHFVADHFAVLYMCANATKTGNALPQITPSPLVDRFYTKLEGLKIARVDRHGIPKDVDEDTLQDWQYALYAIGCTLSFALCYRLDRLMMITKALVGEVYQIEHWKSRQHLWYPRVPAELQHVYSMKNT